MPELPEVETIRRSLLPVVLEKPISNIDLLYRKILRNVSEEDFRRALVGNRFLELARRGKYLLFSLQNELLLVAHLRMTGRLIYVSNREIPLAKHTSLVFGFNSGDALRFEDIRKFGTVDLVAKNQISKLKGLSGLGVEPLSPEFSFPLFQALLEKSSAKVKALLLDQRKIAGLGNIYADESLFLAGIHPERLANSLELQEQRSLHLAIVRVLETALAGQGTTLRDYRTGFGQEGTFQNKLLVYGKKGQPCPRCGFQMEFKKVVGRTSHFCPNCQKE